MDFPPEWNIRHSDEFATAVPKDAGDMGMELLAQVRQNGRILDNYRITLGGSRILDISVPMAGLIPGAAASPWRLRYQVHPQAIEVRRNMSTTAWINVRDIIAARDAVVLDGETSVPAEGVLGMLDATRKAASLRFAVIAGEDMRPRLNLQALPAAAAVLAGKPCFCG